MEDGGLGEGLHVLMGFNVGLVAIKRGVVVVLVLRVVRLVLLVVVEVVEVVG